MKNLLRLQELDLRIQADRKRESEIPRQKNKFDVQKQRLREELKEREEAAKRLLIDQRAIEQDIEQLQGQVQKYDLQLPTVKRNEEYQALLHQIDACKREIAQKEERVLALMQQLEDNRVRLEEDRVRIQGELDEIDRECAEIDKELAIAIEERKKLEEQRAPIAKLVEPHLLALYERFYTRRDSGRAVVALRGDICSGCNMKMRPQVVNEILAGKTHTCSHCGRLLYDADAVGLDTADISAE